MDWNCAVIHDGQLRLYEILRHLEKVAETRADPANDSVDRGHYKLTGDHLQGQKIIEKVD
jgi:hypothetical protein